MILEDIIIKLSGLNTPSIDITNAIDSTIRITELYKTGKIDISEFNELINDIKLDGMITSSAEELQTKEQVKIYIDTTISVINLAINAI